MDRIVECWEALADSRTGNAGLHDFYELLMIALYYYTPTPQD